MIFRLQKKNKPSNDSGLKQNGSLSNDSGLPNNNMLSKNNGLKNDNSPSKNNSLHNGNKLLKNNGLPNDSGLPSCSMLLKSSGPSDSKLPNSSRKLFGISIKKPVVILMLISSILLISTVLLYLVFFYTRSVLDTDTVYPGIYIDDINVGGLTRREALELLNANYTGTRLTDGIMILTPTNKYRLPFDDIKYSPDYGKAIDKAFMTARYGNIVERLLTIRRLRKHSLQIYPEMCYNKEKLAEIIRSISIDTDRKPKNADIKVSDGKIKITPHKSGFLLDQKLSLKRIKRSLDNRIAEDIELFVVEILPDITTQMVDRISYKMGRFSTSFNAYNEGRAHNIKAASDKINQSLLFPGESFSMDKVLGERTEKNGYKQAKVIVNNELVDGLGGGICQVTSTLYNSVLLSGLEVLERRNHTLPLTYIDMGRDATITQGYIDFRFTNNSGYAVIIESRVIGNQVSVTIWGIEPTVKTKKMIRTKIIEIIQAEGVLEEVDNTLKPGEIIVVHEAKPGFKVEVYLDTKDMTGNVIKTEKISVDYYIPQKKKIKISPY
ncbi:MAG: VanW family protein [Ruminiclostridium sp.]|nr:VanW family protein [Ruminiclostridium sp.]